VVWDGDLHPGDLIFIPEYWAHQVRNGDQPTVAVSYNFIDEYSLPAREQLMMEMLDAYLLNMNNNPESRMLVQKWLKEQGFARDEQAFPSFTYDSLEAEASGGMPWQTEAPATATEGGGLPWARFLANNRPRGVSQVDEYNHRLVEWQREGGIKRLFSRLNAERAAGANRVQAWDRQHDDEGESTAVHE